MRDATRQGTRAIPGTPSSQSATVTADMNGQHQRQRWRWAVEEGKVWYPGGMGVIGDVDVPYLITLVDELATHYDSAIGGEGYMYHFCNDLCDVLTGNKTGQTTP